MTSDNASCRLTGLFSCMWPLAEATVVSKYARKSLDKRNSGTNDSESSCAMASISSPLLQN